MAALNTDTIGVAYKEGYQAAANGDAIEKPYKDQERNDAWLKGYKQSCEDFDIGWPQQTNAGRQGLVALLSLSGYQVCREVPW